jgi:kinesin family member 15
VCVVVLAYCWVVVSHTLQNNGYTVKFICTCSYLEVYNDQIADLLDPTKNNLTVHTDLKRGVYVENLTEEVALNSDDMFAFMLKGNQHRSTAKTGKNDHSSRSHSVFTISIESQVCIHICVRMCVCVCVCVWI